MRGYVEFGDEARAAWEEREYSTRRLYSGIRGAICAMDRPRWRTTWALNQCAACALAISLALSFFKLSTPASVFIAILVSWPLFVLFIHRAARQLDKRHHLLQNLESSISADEHRTAQENRKRFGELTEEERKFQESFWNGFHQGMSRGGGGSVIVGIYLALISLCTYLIYRLIREGPDLLADMICHKLLPERIPGFHTRFNSQNWLHNAFSATAVHFIGLATAGMLLAALIPIFPTKGWNVYEKRFGAVQEPPPTSPPCGESRCSGGGPC